MPALSDYVLGVISGSAATLAGFGFTMAWDLWKIRREDNRRKQAIYRAVKHELQENAEIGKTNLALLDEESKMLSEGYLLVPMITFKEGMWDLLKANLPDELLKQTELLTGLRDASLGASHLNVGLASRQVYKDTSGAMSNFHQTLKNRNGLLEAEIKEFIDGIEKLLQLLHEKTGEI